MELDQKRMLLSSFYTEEMKERELDNFGVCSVRNEEESEWAMQCFHWDDDI
jgi:hypothetical protein